jgi:hypothetical protein
LVLLAQIYHDAGPQNNMIDLFEQAFGRDAKAPDDYINTNIKSGNL